MNTLVVIVEPTIVKGAILTSEGGSLACFSRPREGDFGRMDPGKVLRAALKTCACFNLSLIGNAIVTQFHGDMRTRHFNGEEVMKAIDSLEGVRLWWEEGR